MRIYLQKFFVLNLPKHITFFQLVWMEFHRSVQNQSWKTKFKEDTKDDIKRKTYMYAKFFLKSLICNQKLWNLVKIIFVQKKLNGQNFRIFHTLCSELQPFKKSALGYHFAAFFGIILQQNSTDRDILD